MASKIGRDRVGSASTFARPSPRAEEPEPIGTEIPMHIRPAPVAYVPPIAPVQITPVAPQAAPTKAPKRKGTNIHMSPEIDQRLRDLGATLRRAGVSNARATKAEIIEVLVANATDDLILTLIPPEATQ